MTRRFPFPCMVLCAALATPALAQGAPGRGVFVTQIGDDARATIVQRNAESAARIVQDGNGNAADLTQKGDAAHRARIAQDGDGNTVTAQQDGDGTADLALVQEGADNVAGVFQSESDAAAQSAAAILQRGDGNRLLLVQNGTDNQANLAQIGDGNTMSATQLGAGNRLDWTQNGNGLADLGIVQTGGANIQITQSNTGAQFAAPPPSSGGR